MKTLQWSIPLLLAFTVLSCGCTTDEKEDTSDWTVVDYNEKQYQREEATEKIFNGELVKITPDPGPSTLQRDHYYELRTSEGNIDISPGENTWEGDLDLFAGENVKILGKLVTFELEGETITEIYIGKITVA